MSFTLDSRILLMYKNILLPDKDTWMWNREKNGNSRRIKTVISLALLGTNQCYFRPGSQHFPFFFAIWGLGPDIKIYFDKPDFLAKPGFSDLNFLDHLEKSRFVIFGGEDDSKKKGTSKNGISVGAARYKSYAVHVQTNYIQSSYNTIGTQYDRTR